MAPDPARARSWWGWGWADQAVGDDECVQLRAGLPGLRERPRPVPGPADLSCARRGSPLPRRSPTCAPNDPVDRAAHTHGKAYRDVVRNLRMDLDHPPDLVVRPTAEQDVVDVLDWAATRAWRSCPSAAGRRWSAAWSTAATSTARRCRST